MLFNSMHFLLFFPIVTVCYYIIPRRLRYLWLLGASYYFYMSWNPKYALLIALSTVTTYLSGILLERTASHSKKKWIAAGSFIVNLGILIGFKYFDFLLDNLNFILIRLHISMIEKPFDAILPVGISFYTFQALGYTADVYRGKVRAEKNLFRYALFVSFFPQLVAGPIERSENLLSQLQTVPQTIRPDYERITEGLTLMLWGFFQKLVIADRLAVMVDRIFGEYYLYQSAALLAAAIGFAFQIYCDFASYSTIAIGAAQVMGFSLMENFHAPYFAESIQDFWHRWHISLSTWFRDYLYIPLGGSRCGRLRRYCNCMITFMVSGLWHGANWTYVVWGGLHGFYQIVGDMAKPLRKRAVSVLGMKTDSFSHHLGKVMITFIFTDIAWIFFRAESIRAAVKYLWRIAVQFDWWSFMDGSWYIWGMDRQETHVLGFGLILLFLVDLLLEKKRLRLDKFLADQELWFRWGVLLVLLFSVLIFGKYGIDVSQIQFLYFQF